MNWRSFFTPQVLGIFHSKINREIKIVEHFGKKTLFVDEAPQSGGEILPMWKEVIKTINPSIALRTGNQPLDHARGKQSTINNCLILGVGGGNVINTLKKYYPEIEITAIEIDSVMTMIAQKYFGLDTSKNIKIVTADAISWVKEHSSSRSHKGKFDLIVVDLFVGKLNPPTCRTFNFLFKLKELSSKKGIILYNSHYQEVNKGDYKKFLKDCGLVFETTEEIFHYRNNRVLLLRRSPEPSRLSRDWFMGKNHQKVIK